MLICVCLSIHWSSIADATCTLKNSDPKNEWKKRSGNRKKALIRVRKIIDRTGLIRNLWFDSWPAFSGISWFSYKINRHDFRFSWSENDRRHILGHIHRQIDIFSDRLFVSVRVAKVRLKLLMSLEFRNLLGVGVFKVVNHEPRNAW